MTKVKSQEIKLKVNKDFLDERDATIYVNRPGRISIRLVQNPLYNPHLIIYVYDGIRDDIDQEPLGCFDSFNTSNKSWSSTDKSFKSFKGGKKRVTKKS